MKALEQQNAYSNSVIPPLNELAAIQTAQADQAVSEAKAAGNEALIAGLIAGDPRPAGRLGFIDLCLPPDRPGGRPRGAAQQRGGIALGPRANLEDLLEHVRATTGVLSDVVKELRDAARETVSATSEQSSAVAESSATIEELAATATSLSENMRRVSDGGRANRRHDAATCARRSRRLRSGLSRSASARRRSARSSS